MNWLQKLAQNYSGDPGWIGFWVTPEGKIYKLKYSHHSWIANNKEVLSSDYDIDFDSWYMGRLEEEDDHDIIREMLNRLDITVGDFNNDSGVVRIDFSEEVPLWAVEEFTEHFIPIFKGDTFLKLSNHNSLKCFPIRFHRNR